MKKYILLLALCGASFACKKGQDPANAPLEPATVATANETRDGDEDGTDEDGTDEDGSDEDGDGAEGTPAPSEADAAANATREELEEAIGAIELTDAWSEIKVTSAGAAPRRVLTLDLAKMQPGAIKTITDVTTQVMGQTMVMPRMITEVRMRDLKLNGDKLSLTMETSNQRYEKVSDDTMHLMMLESLRQTPPTGAVTMNYSVDKHGTPSDFEVISTDEDLQQAMTAAIGNIRNLSSNFPAEAVGVGATWTTTTRAELGGAWGMEVLVHSTLKELKSDSAVIELRFEAPDFIRSLKEEDLEDFQDAKILGGSLNGSGRSVVRFDSLLSEGEQTMTMALEVEVDGQKMKTEMLVNLKIQAVD